MAEIAVLQQSIRNQTHVSTKLATHFLSKTPNSNVVFSPLSIQVVLGLLAAGSKGQTLDQLLTFLETNTTNDLNSLYSQLVSLILADGSSSGGPRLSFANGVWVDKTLSFKPSFKQVVDNVYKAACKQVDFQKEAVEVVREVNYWAKKQTNGHIRKFLPAGAVTELTRLIFANAIYFKGAWSQTFKRSKTKESDFHLLNSNKVQIPFMTSKEDHLVHEYENFKVLGLPYVQGQDKNRHFTMYFYLPDAKDGLQSLVEKIGSTSSFLDHHIPHQKVKVGRFLIPKFKISYGFEASNMLKELGLELPFSSEADVTKIANSSERLYVSSIHHKSFVEVNEEGTEATAITDEMVMLCSVRHIQKPKRVDFVADHPFLFVIREDVTGAVLFMGQVSDPRVG